MRRFPAPLAAANGPSGLPGLPTVGHPALPGPVTRQRSPQVLFASESLTQAVRQLELNGRDGLPVISDDGQHLQGRHQPERAPGRRPPHDRINVHVRQEESAGQPWREEWRVGAGSPRTSRSLSVMPSDLA